MKATVTIRASLAYTFVHLSRTSVCPIQRERDVHPEDDSSPGNRLRGRTAGFTFDARSLGSVESLGPEHFSVCVTSRGVLC